MRAARHSPTATSTYALRPTRRLGQEIEQLTDELTDLFGRKVDLVSAHGLHPLLRPSVLAEAQLPAFVEELRGVLSTLNEGAWNLPDPRGLWLPERAWDRVPLSSLDRSMAGYLPKSCRPWGQDHGCQRHRCAMAVITAQNWSAALSGTRSSRARRTAAA